jgi:hypothetical protein
MCTIHGLEEWQIYYLVHSTTDNNCNHYLYFYQGSQCRLRWSQHVKGKTDDGAFDRDIHYNTMIDDRTFTSPHLSDDP